MIIERQGEKNKTAASQSDTLRMAEMIISQRQREGLDEMPAICPLSEEVDALRLGDVTCLFRINELVFSRDVGSLDGLCTVLSALNACGASCILLLQCREGVTELYLGAVNKRRHDKAFFLNTIREIVRTGIEGNLPGTEMTEIASRTEIADKLTECLDCGFDSQCITAVSCVAGVSPREGRPERGIETLLEAIGRKNFSILVMADPVDRHELPDIREGYEELGTQLSAMETSTLSKQTGVSRTTTESSSESFTKNISDTVTMTQSLTNTSGWSHNESRRAGKTGRKLLALSSAMIKPGLGMLMMNQTDSDTQSTSLANLQSAAKAHVEQDGQTVQQQLSSAQGTTDSVTVQTTVRQYRVQEQLARIAWYLNWLKQGENFGMFNCCAYVVSSSASVNLLVASQYQALMQSEGEMSQPVAINTWTQSNQVDKVRAALLHLTHPVVLHETMGQRVSPAMLLSGRELARQMALPQKSIVGVSVMEYASFGRDVVRKTPMKPGLMVRIGSIYHMGKARSQQPVLLDVQSLASHTFIAGTNGSGKSNTVFCLLEELKDNGIPFLVIEPAKGEYKNVFGHDEDVVVYGTNRDYTDLLRLNPFCFGASVALREHIDKLIEVFNASWPMYAAMPAVLKAAIESAYKGCGWDLRLSTCEGGRIFPTVRDVLKAFDSKMKTTAFSEEVRGNYVGALSTRLESLANGIYEDIFSGLDLGDEALFERNVIVDISRVGSSETKAMIMGMLLIRLQEHRMSGEAMNKNLRHVTVLEEAHHLLRRTSMAQSDEGSNLIGKSVEMLSNAIAEMRSFGEGFVIVDQSPGVMDMSVIRNTNTKIIMRLPDGGDCDLVRSTMGLTDKQAYEISRFKTGVSAIYQKDWLEAVLCQVRLARHGETKYRRAAGDDALDRMQRALRDRLLAPAWDKEAVAALREDVPKSALSGEIKRRVLAALPVVDGDTRVAAAMELLPVRLTPPRAADVQGGVDWTQWMESMLALNGLGAGTDVRLARRLILEQVRANARTDAAWDKIARDLTTVWETDALRAARGTALALLCPLNAEAVPDEAAIEVARAELSASEREADGRLCEQLAVYQRYGKRRARGEILPYSQIIWDLIDGRAVWRESLPLLMKRSVAEWDARVRGAVLRHADCGRDAQNAVISLYLQHQGKNADVSDFYFKWHAAVMGGGRAPSAAPDTIIKFT